MTVPLYVQIREALVARVHCGEWRCGDRIPAERELCREFGTSRMTVRQALADLVDDGVLTRLQGDGTYVAAPKLDQPLDHLQSLTVTMHGLGMAPGARLIDLDVIPATRAMVERCGFGLGERMYRVVRLRTGNRQPIALENSHFPMRLCPGLEQLDLEQRSIYAILDEVYGLAPVRAEQTLEPTVARAFESKVLEVPEGAPLMLWERVAYAADEQPVEYAKDLYRGDRTRFRVHMGLPR